MKELGMRFLGAVILLYFGYLVLGKQILMPLVATHTEGVVIGFKAKHSNIPVERSYGKSIWDARSAYIRFVPPNATDSITVLSDGNVFFSFLNYDLKQKVKIAYWKDKPTTATIISWREYPLSVFMMLIGCILLFQKTSTKSS